ncbi:hypothetical protein Emag_000131 [Eimeria magna]
MEVTTSSVVVDIGASTTRVGYAAEGAPSQVLNSCIGVRPVVGGSDGSPSGRPRELIFPLGFSERRDGVEVVPALFPTWRGPSGKRKGSANPSYTLHEEAFENIVSLSCTGSLAARSYLTSDCMDAVRDEDTKHPGGSVLRLTELCGIGADLQDQPLLLSEPNVHCREIREKMAEVLFEKLHVGCLYIAKRALLSCIAAGRSSALVLDVGSSGLSIAPVADSFVLDSQVSEWPVGGEAMSQLLGSILVGHNLPVHPSFARFTAQSRSAKVPLDKPGDWDRVHPSYIHWSRMQTLSFLKEGICRVADDPRDIAAARKPVVLPNQQQQHKRRGGAAAAGSDGFMQSQLLFPCASAASAAALLAGTSGSEGGVMELPDGTRLEADQVAMKARSGEALAHALRGACAEGVGASVILCVFASPQTLLLGFIFLWQSETRKRCVLVVQLPEVLFCPMLLSTVPGGGYGFPGLSEAVRQVAEGVESEGYRDLLSVMILTGGCSSIPGMVERVSRELMEDPAVCAGQKVRLLAAPGSLERRYSAWVGGSILSSLSSFQAAWCSREEYEEHGPAVVQRKCY